MKKLITLLFFCPVLLFSQIKKSDKILELTESQMQSLKEFLVSKNLPVKDTIFIKYDYSNESCWNRLDLSGNEYITSVISGFKSHISDFNEKHQGAVAFNFREPGTNFNKLKLWDRTIIIDDTRFLKNLIFYKVRMCGNSAIIFDDGSYILRFSDPHFELLPRTKKK